MSYSTRRTKGDYSQVPNKPGVYRLYHGDKVVYVGETDNLPRRLKEHERDQRYWGSYDYKVASSREAERKEQERRAILANKPTRNITHN